MNIYQLALLIGAAFVGAVTWRLEHALLWILTGAAAFVASTAYARYGLPVSPLFNALCDAAVCFLIYHLATQVWELHLYRIFLVSIFVSVVFLFMTTFLDTTTSKYIYVAILETINWAALLLILGTGIMRWIGADGDRLPADRPRGLHAAREALLAPRPPHKAWWKVR